mgnify:CR=1 FL=1
MEKLFPQKGWNAIRKGHSVFSEENAEQLISLITRKREPDFYAGEHRADIGFIHRRHGKEDIYFVSNISKTEKTGSLCFQCTKPGVTVMDAVTGNLMPIRDIKQQKNHTKITFSMAPNDSCFIVFSETGCLKSRRLRPPSGR